MKLPSSIDIVEVSPRDGLQDETTVLSVRSKVELIERALASGITRVEAVSFVRADLVPMMADAEEVLALLGSRPGIKVAGLVLNERGMQRALVTGVSELNVIVPVSDTFAQRNQGTDVESAMASAHRIIAEAGLPVTVSLAVAFGCPFEGEIDPDRVRALATRAVAFGATEITLADTIGCAVPTEVSSLVRQVSRDTDCSVRVHLHNSRNTGFANAWAAVDAGARSLDSSIGGIGGCPFAPGATGNVATEDLAHMFERMGVSTGLDVDGLIDAAQWLAGVLGHDVPGQLMRSGPFPRRR